MLLSSLEGPTKLKPLMRNIKNKGGKTKNHFLMYDCVPLLCCPECQVLEEKEVGSSLDPLYLLILSQIPCPPNTLLEHAGYRPSSIRKHLRWNTYYYIDALHGLYRKLLFKICISATSQLFRNSQFVLFFFRLKRMHLYVCEYLWVTRRDSELQKFYRMWGYILKMLFSIITASCFAGISFELLGT